MWKINNSVFKNISRKFISLILRFKIYKFINFGLNKFLKQLYIYKTILNYHTKKNRCDILFIKLLRSLG